MTSLLRKSKLRKFLKDKLFFLIVLLTQDMPKKKKKGVYNPEKGTFYIYFQIYYANLLMD